jgi:HPt (histidine-containing phosphotransfer) domain-containing protein
MTDLPGYSPPRDPKPRRALSALAIPLTAALGAVFRLFQTRAHTDGDIAVKLAPKGDELALVLDIDLFQELRESLGNQPDVVAGIYRRFLGSTANTLDELRFQKSDTRVTTLHALKGSAAMVGANRIAAVAARLQDALLHSPDAGAESAVRELEDELAAFRLALTAHLDLTKP